MAAEVISLKLLLFFQYIGRAHLLKPDVNSSRAQESDYGARHGRQSQGTPNEYFK